MRWFHKHISQSYLSYGGRGCSSCILSTIENQYKIYICNGFHLKISWCLSSTQTNPTDLNELAFTLFIKKKLDKADIFILVSNFGGGNKSSYLVLSSTNTFQLSLPCSKPVFLKGKNTCKVVCCHFFSKTLCKKNP